MYPGSDFYVAIDKQQRFVGRDGWLAMTPGVVAALRSGERVDVEWTVWPWGTQETAFAKLEGFGADYDRCVAEMAQRR